MGLVSKDFNPNTRGAGAGAEAEGSLCRPRPAWALAAQVTSKFSSRDPLGGEPGTREHEHAITSTQNK
jgi:hypothetical protein